MGKVKQGPIDAFENVLKVNLSPYPYYEKGPPIIVDPVEFETELDRHFKEYNNPNRAEVSGYSTSAFQSKSVRLLKNQLLGDSQRLDIKKKYFDVWNSTLPNSFANELTVSDPILNRDITISWNPIAVDLNHGVAVDGIDEEIQLHLAKSWNHFVNIMKLRIPDIESIKVKIMQLDPNENGYVLADEPDTIVLSSRFINENHDRLDALITHELFHIFQYNYGLVPHKDDEPIDTPRRLWILEGLATYMEVEVNHKVTKDTKLTNYVQDPRKSIYNLSYDAVYFFYFFKIYMQQHDIRAIPPVLLYKKMLENYHPKKGFDELIIDILNQGSLDDFLCNLCILMEQSKYDLSIVNDYLENHIDYRLTRRSNVFRHAYFDTLDLPNDIKNDTYSLKAGSINYFQFDFSAINWDTYRTSIDINISPEFPLSFVIFWEYVDSSIIRMDKRLSTIASPNGNISVAINKDSINNEEDNLLIAIIGGESGCEIRLEMVTIPMA